MSNNISKGLKTTLAPQEIRWVSFNLSLCCLLHDKNRRKMEGFKREGILPRDDEISSKRRDIDVGN